MTSPWQEKTEAAAEVKAACDELNDAIRRAVNAGVAVEVHTIEMRTIEQPVPTPVVSVHTSVPL